MKWMWKRTYIEAGEFGGGHEQIIIIKRAGGTYKWMKVANRAGWARFVCAMVWHGQWVGVVVVQVVVVVGVVAVVEAAVVVWWWCRRGGGGAAAVVVVAAAAAVAAATPV